MARLLVIEDNPDNLELMTYLLKAAGHRVASAPDGAEGLAAVRRDPPEVIVCDVHLPKVDGYEVARQLKADPRLGRIPLLAVTALAMVGDRDKVLAAGFDGYLAKPIDPPEFARQVEHYLPAGSVAPAPAVPPATADPAPARPPPGQRGRILAVDDNAANREVIRATLEPSGFAVTLAPSVHAALALLARQPFDLIVSDLHMPKEDGYAFIGAVRNDPRWRAIPFMCVSSSVWGERDRQHMLELGAARFILRPVEPQRLLAEVEDCLCASRKVGHDDPDGRLNSTDAVKKEDHGHHPGR